MDMDDRRLHWMTFIGVIVGMAILGTFLLQMLSTIRANHREDEVSRRARYEACQSLENEITRSTCINGRG
jgi:NADH:ubiquinone oxidoreductase subunit 3 (subunit A)